MPDYLILLLMQITIFSSVTACIIILVKQLFKWVIPPSVGVIMWLILLIRLAWPVLPESAVSIYNLIPAGKNIMYSLTNEMGSELSAPEENNNPYVVDQAVLPEETEQNHSPLYSPLYKEEDTPLTVGEYVTDTVYPAKTRKETAHISEKVNHVILILYALGASTVLTANALTYKKARLSALVSSLPCTDDRVLAIYRATAAKLGIKQAKLPPLKYGSSTMIVGCIRPTIVYREQEGLTDREISMIFAHELNHFKHRDNFVLMFSTYVAGLFWYNPLIWIVRHMLREDIEVMCDARTISECNIRRGEYAQLIYSSSEQAQRYVYAGCHISYGNRELKNRLRTISRNLENKLIPRITSVVLCLCIILICLTNPIVSQNIEYADYIKNYANLTGESERTMHLTSNVSVSYYLKQICTLLYENFDSSLSVRIGNGSLENLKRLVKDSGAVEKDIVSRLDSFRSDQPLTVESCAIINLCIVELLSDSSFAPGEITLPILPQVMSTESMNKLKSSLSPKEYSTVSKCYNLGVEGADVKFEPYYTEAMYELIMSRIDSQSSRDMWNSFYSRVDLSEEDLTALYSRLGVDISALKNENCLYVISPSVSPAEEKLLRNIIESAYAGQDESAYYLRKNLEGYTEYALHLTLSVNGYTAWDMIDDYAKLGVPQYYLYTVDNCEYLTHKEYDIIEIRLEGSGMSIAEYYSHIDGSDYYVMNEQSQEKMAKIIDYLNEIAFVKLRSFEDDSISIKGVVSNKTKSGIEKMYDLGLIDAKNGIIELGRELACGESLYYSYKMVCSFINANR